MGDVDRTDGQADISSPRLKRKKDKGNSLKVIIDMMIATKVLLEDIWLREREGAMFWYMAIKRHCEEEDADYGIE